MRLNHTDLEHAGKHSSQGFSLSGISCVQFDDDHIVSGSSDNTIKVGANICCHIDLERSADIICFCVDCTRNPSLLAVGHPDE